MLEKNGVRIAAVSYDAQGVLQRFADDYSIQFPLLSDRDSEVIAALGSSITTWLPVYAPTVYRIRWNIW